MTPDQFFKMAAMSQKSTSGFRFSVWARSRKWKSMCIPYFDDISQSTAELKLLLVSENGQPPYWNSSSGFDFDLYVVIS